MSNALVTAKGCAGAQEGEGAPARRLQASYGHGRNDLPGQPVPELEFSCGKESDFNEIADLAPCRLLAAQGGIELLVELEQAEHAFSHYVSLSNGLLFDRMSGAWFA
ncbi:hypothetical protein ACFSHP_00260 [Novosphingobium panipatense]